MNRAHLQSASNEVLWRLAHDAYERQADSQVPSYIHKQLNIVYTCLEELFDRLERGERLEASRD